MNFTDMLGAAASVAVAVERITEVLKPAYLAVKNKIFKKNQLECTKLEKNIITILLGIFICMSMKIGIDIPGIPEGSILQEIFAGLVSSPGSGILHTLLSILAGLKNAIEVRAIK